MTRRRTLALLLVCLAPRPVLAKDAASAAALLRAVDERRHNPGDSRSVVYVEQHQKGREALVYEMTVMSRGADGQSIMLFTKPTPVAGQGYLRIDRQVWFYDPAVSRWERRTERERVGATTSRPSDFDESTFSASYEAEDGGVDKVGQRSARRLLLKGKPGVDVAFPVIHLWIDEEAKVALKRQDFALSGRLLRTLYYPRWDHVPSPVKKADVWYPKEIRLYDELEPGTSTLVMIKDVSAAPLPQSMFTKTWVEHQSH
ncbi:MAG: outer membrane lipoprotein-sorting protein [Verrucomicrobiota bacterium]